MTYAININQLKKVFPKFTFGPATFHLSHGESIVFLGHNGAGKTTLFQMLTGQMDATEGEIQIEGEKMLPEAFMLKRKLGYLPQNLDLPDWVTAEEILNYGSKLYGLPETRVKEIIELWAIESYRRHPLAVCSHGMRKRVGLGLAMIHDPEILILDEPFSGLDISHIKTLKDIIRSRNTRGKTTILCTHILPYAAELCSQAILFRQGQVKVIHEWPNLDQHAKIDLAEQLIFPTEVL